MTNYLKTILELHNSEKFLDIYDVLWEMSDEELFTFERVVCLDHPEIVNYIELEIQSRLYDRRDMA